MVRKRYLLEILVIILVFGFMIVSCDNGSKNVNSGNNGGDFIATVDPRLIGKWEYPKINDNFNYSAGWEFTSNTLIQWLNMKPAITGYIYTENGSIFFASGNLFRNYLINGNTLIISESNGNGSIDFTKVSRFSWE